MILLCLALPQTVPQALHLTRTTPPVTSAPREATRASKGQGEIAHPFLMIGLSLPSSSFWLSTALMPLLHQPVVKIRGLLSSGRTNTTSFHQYVLQVSAFSAQLENPPRAMLVISRVTAAKAVRRASTLMLLAPVPAKAVPRVPTCRLREPRSVPIVLPILSIPKRGRFLAVLAKPALEDWSPVLVHQSVQNPNLTLVPERN